VSGSVPQVKTGTLTIMIGDADAFIRVESALRVLCTPVHVGGNSQGLVLKLAINISLAAQMLALSEMHKDIRLALAAAREDCVRLPPRRSRRTFRNGPPTLAASTVTLR
jgi:hypothetical protein